MSSLGRRRRTGDDATTPREEDRIGGRRWVGGGALPGLASIGLGVAEALIVLAVR